MVVGVVGYSQGTKAAGKRLCGASEDLCMRVKTCINKLLFPNNFIFGWWAECGC